MGTVFLSVLSVTLVYIAARQLDGSRWHLVLGPGHIVLDGTHVPPMEWGTAASDFSAKVYCGQTVAHLSYNYCLALVAFSLYFLIYVARH